MTGPAPGDQKGVSYPKYMLVGYASTRARSPVNCEAPNGKANGDPDASSGSRAFSKRKSDRARGVSWQFSARKPSITSSIRTRITSRLAGSTAVDDWQGVVFFRFLFHRFLRSHVSNGTID